MLTKCLQHHQGCPETPKNADVICERLLMLWTLWDLKYHFWNILFCHRHTGSIGHRQQCSVQYEWFRVTGGRSKLTRSSPCLPTTDLRNRQRATCRLAPRGRSLEMRLPGHLERGGAQEIGDQLLTRVSNLALSNEETGIVQTDHSVRQHRSVVYRCIALGHIY